MRGDPSGLLPDSDRIGKKPKEATRWLAEEKRETCRFRPGELGRSWGRSLEWRSAGPPETVRFPEETGFFLFRWHISFLLTGQALAAGGFGFAGVDRRSGGLDQSFGLAPIEGVPLERPGDLFDRPRRECGQIGGGGVAHEHLPHDLGERVLDDRQGFGEEELQEGN